MEWGLVGGKKALEIIFKAFPGALPLGLVLGFLANDPIVNAYEEVVDQTADIRNRITEVFDSAKDDDKKEDSLDRSNKTGVYERIKQLLGANSINEYYDSQEGMFDRYKNGDITKVKKKETLSNGEVVLRDHMLTFYYPVRGDNVSTIRQKLIKYPEFAYLKKCSLDKLKCFNSNKIYAGQPFPLPVDIEKRVLSDEEFFKYAKLGIDEMLQDEHYGESVELIIDSIGGEGHLLNVLYALARHESGGEEAIGTYALHRYEPGPRAYSYSMYHVLGGKGRNGAKQPGQKAREKLEITEGQSYHPVNATKMVLGYLVEKFIERRKLSERGIQSVIPTGSITESEISRFCKFYNGVDNNEVWKTRVKKYMLMNKSSKDFIN